MRTTLTALGLGDVQLQSVRRAGATCSSAWRSSRAASRRSRRRSTRSARRSATEVEYRRVEVVGPRVSSELLSYGTIGIISAIGAILIYLWFRFEWQFALGAMIANVHDLVLTLGFMAIMQIDFDLTIDRGAADHSRLFAERHRRHLRPYPRDAAALQEAADDRTC